MATGSRGLTVLMQLLIFASLAAGLSWCIYLISAGDLSNRESALLGILVTVLSVLASWVITHMYSASQHENAIRDVKEEHRNNLQTYALKAAEKVNNLSNELNKLSIYLEEELNYTEYRSAEEELVAKEERIESAIHLIRTLKSVNDTALSDWEGVIGDELDQRREEKEEKEEEVKELIQRVEALIESQRLDFAGTQKYTKTMQQQIESLKRELRLATFQLSDTTIPKRIRKKEPRQDVLKECPVCKSHVNYTQRPSIRSVKIVSCKECNAKLVSTYSERDGFSLRVRVNEDITAHCPACSAENIVSLDIVPGVNVQVSCSSCHRTFTVVRTIGGIESKPLVITSQGPAAPAAAMVVYSEELINRVRDALPPQPWPKGTSHKVAVGLDIPQKLVTRAIQELIRRGIFLLQIDGTLYAPRDNNPPSHGNSASGAQQA
jgi:predicted Zn finger-like uncharacterized protein